MSNDTKATICVSYLIFFFFVMGGFILGYEYSVPYFYELSWLAHPFLGVALMFYLVGDKKQGS